MRRNSKKKRISRAEREQRIWSRRLRVAYSNMQRRLGKLPFTLERLRKEFLPQPDLVDTGLRKKGCALCHDILNPRTFSVDHSKPISRGGSKRLANLQLVCAGCNRAKGELTSEEYRGLLQFLDDHFAVEARTSVLRRLKSAPQWLR